MMPGAKEKYGKTFPPEKTRVDRAWAGTDRAGGQVMAEVCSDERPELRRQMGK